MAHWKSVLPGRIYDYHYEDVVNDQHTPWRWQVPSRQEVPRQLFARV
jgi:hypothetical protein